MPIVTQLTSQKFYSQYRNGETWASLPNDFTYWLLGSVGERLRTEIEVSVRWDTGTDGSPNDGFKSVNGDTFTRQSGSFIDDGFILGDEILAYSSGVVTSPNLVTSAIITYLDATTMVLDSAISGGNQSYSWIIIRGITDLEGCLFKYGIIGNNEAINFDSKVDFNEQAYSINGLVTSGSALTMNPQNDATVRSWQNGEITCQYISETNGGTIKNYKIVHDFIVLPYGLESFLTNIQNGTLPAIFDNGESLKYAFQANFRSTINNPNDNKSITFGANAGSCGYYGQNFNGFPNDYTISGVAYEEVITSDSQPSLIVDKKTRCNFDININSGSFVGTEQVIIGVSYLPIQSDYANNLETIDENFLFDSKLTTVGAGAVSSSIIQDLTVTNGGSSLSVQVDFEYSASQQTKLDDSKNYVIWALIGSDLTLLATNEANKLDDRVSLIVDTQLYQKNADVADIFSVQTDEFKFYKQFLNESGGVGYSDFKGWITDNYCVTGEINMDYSKGDSIETASFKLAAYNETTGDFFTLEEQAFPIQANSVFFPYQFNPTTTYQIQSIDIQANRGYNLELTDQFNAFEWSTNLDINGQPNTADSIQKYYFKVGFKLNYEEWLSLPSANTIFLNNNEPQNGLNKKASNYSLANGYKIVVALDLTALSGTASTDYRFISEGEVYDFHEDGTAKPFWSCAGLTSNEDATQSFGGLTMSDENTRIRFTFTPDTYTAGLDYYARISCDDLNGSIFSIRDLSSLTGVTSGFNDASPTSELMPLSGLTGVQITDTGSVIRIECLVDHTKIDVNKCYKYIGRLWVENELDGGEIEESSGTELTELSQAGLLLGQSS